MSDLLRFSQIPIDGVFWQVETRPNQTHIRLPGLLARIEDDGAFNAMRIDAPPPDERQSPAYIRLHDDALVEPGPHPLSASHRLLLGTPGALWPHYKHSPCDKCALLAPCRQAASQRKPSFCEVAIDYMTGFVGLPEHAIKRQPNGTVGKIIVWLEGQETINLSEIEAQWGVKRSTASAAVSAAGFRYDRIRATHCRPGVPTTEEVLLAWLEEQPRVHARTAADKFGVSPEVIRRLAAQVEVPVVSHLRSNGKRRSGKAS